MANKTGSSTSPEYLSYCFWIIFFSLCYFAIGKLMLMIASSHVSLVWPSAGLALGVLIIKGGKYWPFILIGSFLSNISLPFNIAFFIASGSTISTAFAWYVLIKLRKFTLKEGDYKQLAEFVLYGCIVSPVIAAMIGSLTLFSYGFVSSEFLLSSFFSWWFGDGIGVLILGSMIIMIAEPYMDKSKH